eukprot:m.184538 g.184538  ORF g.184538 m.184538 type:complete len:70 (+) comp16909_c0_seq9:541-750(+)
MLPVALFYAAEVTATLVCCSLQAWNSTTRAFFQPLDGWCPCVYLGCCERLGTTPPLDFTVWLDPDWYGY